MINHNRWTEVEKVFNTVCELPKTDQVIALTDICRGDPALFDEVDSLLKFDRKSEDFLEKSIFESSLMILAGS